MGNRRDWAAYLIAFGEDVEAEELIEKYAVNGIDESWSFYNIKINYSDYMKQLNGFTLKKYDPTYWAGLIHESGARYAVVTTKHHDGVAMYDTRMNQLSIVKKTPDGGNFA